MDKPTHSEKIRLAAQCRETIGYIFAGIYANTTPEQWQQVLACHGLPEDADILQLKDAVIKRLSEDANGDK